MNFVNMPELEWELGYLFFWMVCVGTFICVLLLFRFLGFFRTIG
jgi:Mg2+ and Co2+ transporter CorA